MPFFPLLAHFVTIYDLRTVLSLGGQLPSPRRALRETDRAELRVRAGERLPHLEIDCVTKKVRLSDRQTEHE